MLNKENLRPFLKPPTGIGRGKGRKAKAPAQAAASIPQAKTIAEANQLAVQLGLAQHADFDGLDISVANEMIAQIKAARELAPDLPELGIIGSSLKVNQYFYGTPGGRARILGAFTPPTDTVRFHKNEIAIEINQRLCSSSELQTMLKLLPAQVQSEMHPVGFSTMKAVVDHEIGHWIDHKYNISKDRRIRSLFRKYHEAEEDYYITSSGDRVCGSKKMGSVLSRYANTNVKEFLAEGWGEYRNNPNPRPLAKEIGDIMMSYIRGNS